MHSLEEACRDVDVCIAVGGMPRKQGMERKDLIAANAPIFVPLGKALNEVASRDVRVLVRGNSATFLGSDNTQKIAACISVRHAVPVSIV